MIFLKSFLKKNVLKREILEDPFQKYVNNGKIVGNILKEFRIIFYYYLSVARFYLNL